MQDTAKRGVMIEMLSQKLYKNPQYIKGEDVGCLLDRINRYTMCDHRGIQLVDFIDYGKKGYVYKGVFTYGEHHGRPCAVKIVPCQDQKEANAFGREVYMHALMQQHLEDMVVKMYDSFVVRSTHTTIGVIVMELIGSTMHDILDESHGCKGEDMVVSAAAKELKMLCEKLISTGLVHGDLHFGNVAWDGVGPSKIFDFGRSLFGQRMTDIDSYMVWCASIDPRLVYGGAINQALHQVQFPGSAFFQLSLRDYDVTCPVHGTHDHSPVLFYAQELTGMCVRVAEKVVPLACVEHYDSVWATRRFSPSRSFSV
jgi:hypothetical protein